MLSAEPEPGKPDPLRRLKACMWLLTLIVIALVSAACTGDTAGTTTTSTTSSAPPDQGGDLPVLEDVEFPEWEPTSRTEQISAQIDDEGLTPQLAIDALSLIVDDVPGASSSDLPPGEGFGGYYTSLLLEEVRDDLTQEQRSFVDAYFAEGRHIGTVRADGSIESAGEPTSASPLLVSVANVAVPQVLAAAPVALSEDDYLELLAQVHQHWLAYLPMMPEFDVKLTFSDTGSGMSAGMPETGLCHIEVYGSFTNRPQVLEDEVIWFFAHELFHCAQHTWRGATIPPDWVIEGSADWAAYDLLRNETLDFEGGFVHWFEHSLTPLKARAYSAWPLYENGRLSGIDVYAAIEKMVHSPGPSETATLAVGGLDGFIFRKDWSSRTLRNQPFGATWWLPWPTHDPQSGPIGNSYALARGLGTYNVNGTGDYAQPQLAVALTEDVDLITASPLGGPLTTWTALGTKTVADGSTAKFCFRSDGCTCPSGTSSDAIPMANRIMLFSYPASEDAAKSAVKAESWDPNKECKEEEDFDEAESNGDPHLLTFDGLAYDVITLGEFVTARDPNGDFEVQTRHEPFRFGAGTTAVALWTGSSRITFTTPDFITPESVIRVDGAVTEEDVFETGGVTVRVGDVDIAATWPDGSTVTLHWFLGYFVEVSVPPERSARMEGLMGSADGDLGNDLKLPGGTFVDTTEAQIDESPFVLAWAVDEETTRFDYEPGESVATFRIPHPNPNPPPIDDGARDQCESALGEEATAYEVGWCAYDVSVTEDTGFVDAYVREVEERVGGDVLAPPVPDTTSTTTPPAGSVSGEPTLILSGNEPIGSVEVSAGSVLVAVAGQCTDDLWVDLIVRVVDDPDLFATADLCAPGPPGVDEWFTNEAYLWLPGATTYEVILNVFRGDPDVLGDVAIYTDPTPTIIDASGLGDGDSRGLDGIADTVVYLPDPAMEFDLTGFDQACGVEIYWSATFPRLEPWNLRTCEHPARYDQPPTDRVIPFVVFQREDGHQEIILTRAE